MKKSVLEENQLKHVRGGNNSNNILSIRINYDLCTGCRSCVDQCPRYAIKMENDKPVITISQCVLCAVCCDVCPNKAIEIA